ncbi:helix-turn-helix domain-containing protein [Saccharopolyspora gloriosae]|uniref:helix-turn-helix domain-containing protein n=1 Tax=Saccharopolyspora gloriosae TaxID=455344 RepID=UPI001FB7633C|nr:helix-turn-helix domain-containing protein [Saccharopolyspora gloriosae]
MNEDWRAVGQAIGERLDERGTTMTDLATQAEVSLTTVRELVHVLSTRRRNPRTLSRISKALGWPEDHLQKVLRGGESSTPDAGSDDLQAVRAELRALRKRVEQLEKRLS